MKRFFKLTLALLLLAGAVSTNSCVIDVSQGGENPENGEVSDAITLRIAVPVPPKATRALEASDEYAVDEIGVLAFKTDVNKTLKGRYPGSVVPGSLKGTGGASATLDFEVTLPEGTFDLMIVANGNSLLDAASLVGGVSKQADVETALKATMTGSASTPGSGGWGTDPDAPGYKNMAMWGWVKGVNIAHTDDFTQDSETGKPRFTKQDIYLTRMVAKVDVMLGSALKEATKQGDPSTKKFVLESVRVYNFNKEGYLIPDLDPATNGGFPWATLNTMSLGYFNTPPQKPRIPAGTTADPYSGEFIDRFLSAGATELRGEIYIFEAATGVPPINAQDGGQAYKNNVCLVIGGKYNGGPTTYYRIDFAKKTDTAQGLTWTYMPVLRNNSYSVTIGDVNGPGMVDEITALESIPANIDADVLDWVNEEIKEVTSNGLYMLGVSSSRFVFPKPAQTIASDGNELYITTDYWEGWTAEVFDDNGEGTAPATTQTGSDWLTISQDTGDGNYPGGNPIRLLATENTSGGDRTAWVRITAGDLTYNVRVIQTIEIPYAVTITDPVTGEPITALNFPGDNGTPGGAPEPQSFKVSWTPADRPLTITRIQTGVEPFTWRNTANNSLTTIPAGGSFTFENIDPEAIVGSAFLNRVSSLNFMVSDNTGETSASRSISLFQGNRIDNVVGALGSIYSVAARYDGSNHNITFTSQATGKIAGTNVSGPVAWIAEFSENGGEYTPTAPEWLVGFPMSGVGNLPSTAYTVKPTTVASRSSDGEFDDRAVRGSQSTPWNLAGNPAAGDLSGAETWETANCYIVNNPGWYSIPLAYGNAVQDGIEATTYIADGTASANFLKNFIRHDGKAINSSYIYNNTGFASPIDDATLVWQDVPGMLTDIALDSAKENLVFHIDADAIAQGNSVVAVRDAAGTIMWSWHVWVTRSDILDAADLNAATKPTKTHTNYGSKYNSILEYALGYVKGSTAIYAARSVSIRISQVGIKNPATRIFTVSHADQTVKSGNVSTFYQWGRKDAMIPSNGNNNTESRMIEWGVRKDGKPYNTIGDAASGEAAVSIKQSQPLMAMGTGNITKSIVNPHIFCAASAIEDWNKGTSTPEGNKTGVNNLWSRNNNVRTVNGNAVAKTVYDPSPAGFKMPPSDAWTAFTMNANLANGTASTYGNILQPVRFSRGYTFYLDGWMAIEGATSFYEIFSGRAAAGELLSGSLTSSGRFWSAGPASASYGYDLSVSSGSINPRSDISRGLGSSVRPMAEWAPEPEPAMPDPPGGMTKDPTNGGGGRAISAQTYVGAFWRAGEKGERLIKIPVTDAAGSGKWIVRVYSYGGNGIYPKTNGNPFDPAEGVSTDFKKGDIIFGAYDGTVPNNLNAEANPVTGGEELRGEVATGGEIAFRIGLKQTWNGSAPRYAVAVITYGVTESNPEGYHQLLFLRQGQQDDYLMLPSDPVTGVSITPVNGKNRPLAKKWSPYNLTAQKFKGAGVPGDATQARGTEGNSWVDVRPWGEATKAVYTDYPTQIGAYFKWAHSEGVRAYNPSGQPATPQDWDWNTSGFVTSAWDNTGAITIDGTNIGAMPMTGKVKNYFESCPADYRRPTDGGDTDYMDATGEMDSNKSETLQSLFSNIPTYTDNNVQNSVWGRYADGFFDRQAIVNSLGLNPNPIPSAVSVDNSAVAYIGRLFHNPTSYNSLFFPTSGNRYNSSGALSYAGGSGNYWSSSLSDTFSGWGLFISGSDTYRRAYQRNNGYPIRCIADE